MTKMNAAVVTSFDQPPQYRQCDVPEARTPDETLIDVLAVGLHPRVRTGAAGAHYTSSGSLPMIPGIDGVGRRADGRAVYFVAVDDVMGTMADKALVDERRAIELPAGSDEARVAAAMNPAMSSSGRSTPARADRARPERAHPRRDRKRGDHGRSRCAGGSVPTAWSGPAGTPFAWRPSPRSVPTSWSD